MGSRFFLKRDSLQGILHDLTLLWRLWAAWDFSVRVCVIPGIIWVAYSGGRSHKLLPPMPLIPNYILTIPIFLTNVMLPYTRDTIIYNVGFQHRVREMRNGCKSPVSPDTS